MRGLESTDKLRVEESNELYKFVAEAAPLLTQMGISWVVENPTNSLMWSTKWFTKLLAETCSRITCQMFMHGGQRDKKTDLVYGGPIDLRPMALMCDGKHEHLPWTQVKEAGCAFATGPERNYPEMLCRRLAKRAALACNLPNLRQGQTNPTRLSGRCNRAEQETSWCPNSKGAPFSWILQSSR